MSTAITSIFRELHRLRRHLRDLQSEIDLGPRVLKARQAALAAAEAAHKEAHDAVKRLKLKQKEDEGALKTTEQRLDRLHQQAMEVTTLKEIEAKKSEITQATAVKGDLEDRILATITEIEERTAKLPADDKAWADAQAEFKQSQLDAEARLQRMKEDQAECTAKLAETEATLPPDVKGEYARLVKAYGPDGLAAVKNKVCQQCRTTLTAQRMMDLQAGQFLRCTSCGRGLYPSE